MEFSTKRMPDGQLLVGRKKESVEEKLSGKTRKSVNKWIQYQKHWTLEVSTVIVWFISDVIPKRDRLCKTNFLLQTLA